jgi:hypothetical protein
MAEGRRRKNRWMVPGYPEQGKVLSGAEYQKKRI